MTPRPFQFTLRRLFIATAYVSVGFGLVVMIFRAQQDEWEPVTIQMALLLNFVTLAVFPLMGAGVGEILGSALKGAKWGILAGVLLYLLLPYELVIVPTIWRMLQ